MLLNSKWITYTTGEYKTADDKYGNPSPYFRKQFDVCGEIDSAELLISALGVYKVYINGESVSCDYLSPGWVDYSIKLPMIRYDVKSMLREKNAIGVVLGDGWAVGHIGSNYTFKRNGYSDRIEFTATIVIKYKDGSEQRIITDESWRASQGEIRRSDIYMGEVIDHRMALGNFSSPDYDDSEWDSAEVPQFKFSRNIYLEEQDIPPIVVKHTFVPTLISQEGNRYLYDVSQNMSGVLRVRCRGNAGDTLTLRHGELLQNGALYTENLRKAEATDTFILSGEGEEEFRPIFTFHGFRYFEITVEGSADILDIVAEVMYTDLECTGEFSCSDPIVTKVYLNALWGQRGNFLNVPTDCPQRDERLGWTADTQVFCQSAMYNMDCRKFFKKYMADMRDAQLGNGVIPAVAPLPHVAYYDYTGKEAAAGWCEAIAEIPYHYYKMYGDKKVISENLPAIKRLIAYYEKESPDLIRRSEDAYGDWLSIGKKTDLAVVSTLFFARAAYVAYEFCRTIGDYEEDYYRGLYERIKAAFVREFVDSDGRITSDTQSAYIIAYKFGIIDIDTTRVNLVRKIKEDGHLTSGFLGIRFLLPTLCDIGRPDIAYQIICNRDYPGWAYSVMNGATTIWEHWDSYTLKGGIKKGMNSFNHYSFGSCTEWMYEYCLGICPSFDAPGFESVLFRPYIDTTGRIDHAEGYYVTEHGKISVSWKKCGGVYEYLVEKPECIPAEFDFFGMTVLEKNVCGSKYIFKLRANE